MAEMNGIQALLSRLALLPERIASIIEGKKALELHSRSEQDKWSAAEIFAHIRASDDIVSPRIYAVLVREHAPLGLTTSAFGLKLLDMHRPIFILYWRYSLYVVLNW